MNNNDNSLTKTIGSLYRTDLEEAVKAKAADIGFGYVYLKGAYIQNDVLSFFSREEVIKYSAFPIDYNENILTVAITDAEKDFEEFFKELKKQYLLIQINIVLISEPSFVEFLSRYKNIEKKVPFDKDDNIVDLTNIATIKSFDELQAKLQATPVQELLKVILFMAFESKASDIHVEPREGDTYIRYRLDGTLHHVATLNAKQYKYVLSQVELQSELKLNAKIPQGGRFALNYNDTELGVRIETMPTMYGDDIVIRLFSAQTTTLDISDLGLGAYDQPKLENALNRPHGMILIVGPTGSGKTTTIYAILNRLNTESVKIITLEDPVEYTLVGAVQSQINEGESFFERLKAVLREDPDIIMVGEIRDGNTASVAIQAALTGHLMVSTLHANDAVTAISRYIDLVNEPSLFAASTNLIIAQRLVRIICPDCRKEYIPTPFEDGEITRIVSSLPEELKPIAPYKFTIGAGCDKCKNLGFKGRIGIFEILEMKRDIQILISEGANIFSVREKAIESGMVTMEQDGLLKSLSGVTTIGEVLRVIKE
ncbi:MAG: GspE/PulE family protein [bacterium]